MANNIIKRIWNQNKMVNIEALDGMAFQAEDGGHTFEISGVDDSGNPIALSGTVAGVFLRPDNADIALSGTASDGKIYVTLSDACYAIPGKFGLTIFVTAGGKKTAVYAAIGTVNRTSGGAVAGSTPQDVVDLVNAISAAVATIPASYTDLMAAIAPTYSNTALYSVGAYAWYDGKLYRCKANITTAESWTAAHWSTVKLGNEIYRALKAGTITISAANYEQYFTDANNAPVNTIFTIVGTITSSMIANLPRYGVNTTLITVTGVSTGTNEIIQIFSDRSGGNIYVRGRSYTGTWGDWRVIAFKDYVDSQVNNAFLPGVIVDETNYTDYFTDANNAPRNRSYTILGSVTSEMISNLPVYGVNGIILTVSGNVDGRNTLMQIYYTLTDVYIRTCGYTQEYWTDWSIIAFKDYVDNQIDHAFLPGGIITNTNYTDYFTDANNAPRNRSYTIYGVVTSEMISNLPRYATNGVLTTISGNVDGNNVLMQIYNTFAEVYIRTCGYTQENWTLWRKISTVNEYYVGPNRKWTSLTQCFYDLRDDETPKIIYVDGGEYDIAQEYADANIPVIPDDGDYNSGYTPYNVWVPKNAHVIGRGRVVLRYDPSTEDVSATTSKTVSPMNAHYSCTVENMTIECTNGRYAAHLDGQGNSAYSDSIITFKNVRFIRNQRDEGYGWSSTVGIGFDRRQSLIFEECVFENNITSGVNIFAHNRNAVGGTSLTIEKSSHMILKNCIFLSTNGGEMFKLESRSIDNLLDIEVKLYNCYINGEIYLRSSSGASNCFDLTVLNSGQATIRIDDANNPYPPKAYNTTLTAVI